MKYLVALVFILMLSGPAHALHGATHILVTVNGLVCDFCAQSIKKTFLGKDSVADIDVNLSEKKVRIDLKSGASLNDDEVKRDITDAGYTVVDIQRDE